MIGSFCVWAHLDSNQGPTGYASHYSFHCPFRVCGLDCPFTLVGCLPSSLYTFLMRGLARDYPILRLRLPRIWQVSPEDCSSGSPRQRVILKYNIAVQSNANCIVCGARLQGRQTRFCSLACKNKYHQSYEFQKSRGLARKIEIVKAAGGRCSICGYQANLAALAFHHKDSEDKDFKLDMRSLSNRALESVLAELDKCVLVCHNCHAELHNPHLNLDSLP